MNTTVALGGTTTNISSIIETENNLTEIAAYVALEICIAVFAFTCNVFVIAALWKFHSLRTATNYFVASLAVADIAVATFAIPSAILLRFGLSVTHEECDDVTELPHVGEAMCLIMVSSVVFLTQVSIFSLLLIAFDRFIAINYPFKYRTFMRTTRVRICIVAAWLLAGLVGAAPEYKWNKWANVDSSCDKDKCAFEQVVSMEFMVYFNFFVCVLTPLIALAAMYFFIFRSAKKQLQKIYFDVKKLKARRNEAKASESQPSYSTVTTLIEMSNILHGITATDSKIQNEKHSLSPTRGCENRVQEPLKDENQEQHSTDSVQLKFSANNVETAGSLNSNILAQSTAEEHSSSDSENSSDLKLEAPEKLVSLAHNDTSGESAAENDPKLYLKKDESIGSPTYPKPSPLIKRCISKSKSATCATKTTPPEKSNNDQTSLQSSHSTIYAGQNSAQDQDLRRKMKRKRQLLKKEFQAARSLATVVGLFAFCWLPLHILNSITLFCPSCYQPQWLKDLAILLSHANSLLNPLIYAYKLRDFRNAFHKLLLSICPCKSTETATPHFFSDFKICCLVTSQSSVTHESISDDHFETYDSSRNASYLHNAASQNFVQNAQHSNSNSNKIPLIAGSCAQTCAKFQNQEAETSISPSVSSNNASYLYSTQNFVQNAQNTSSNNNKMPLIGGSCSRTCTKFQNQEAETSISPSVSSNNASCPYSAQNFVQNAQNTNSSNNEMPLIGGSCTRTCAKYQNLEEETSISLSNSSSNASYLHNATAQCLVKNAQNSNSNDNKIPSIGGSCARTCAKFQNLKAETTTSSSIADSQQALLISSPCCEDTANGRLDISACGDNESFNEVYGKMMPFSVDLDALPETKV